MEPDNNEKNAADVMPSDHDRFQFRHCQFQHQHRCTGHARRDGDDTTVYDSVTLQLNLANGTFTVLDATLRDTTFENAVVDSVTESGLEVDFYGCVLTGKIKSRA